MDLDVIVNEQQDRIISSFSELEFAKKITSLNNTSGGKLLIGINEKGKVVGVYPKDELENIPFVIANICSKSLIFNSEILEIKNKLIIVLTIQKTDKIATLSKDKTLAYYYRIEQNIVIANKIIEKLWRFERDKPSISPCSTEEQALVIQHCHNQTLSQLYNYTKLPKSVVDITISWLLFCKKIKMVFQENLMTYQQLR